MRIKSNKHYDVAIVRSDAIGDFVMWMSTFPSYKNKFKGKSILFICPKSDKELAEASGIFNEILDFDRNAIIESITYFVKYMFKIKHISVDLVINPTWQHLISADYICAMLQSPEKIGTLTPRYGIRNKLCDKYYTKLIDMPNSRDASEFEAIEYFTRKVIDINYNYRLSNVSKILNNNDSFIKGRYCCISLSSSSILKDWPIEWVAMVIKCIPNFFSIVLLGYGNDDLNKASILIAKDSGNHVVHNYVNKTSVLSMLSVISKASFVMGNDSVAVHMAAASRVRSICYTHGAQYERFVPYPEFIPEKEYHPRCVYKMMDCFGCNYRCKYDRSLNKPLFCLREVTPHMVIVELKKLIKEISIN